MAKKMLAELYPISDKARRWFVEGLKIGGVANFPTSEITWSVLIEFIGPLAQGDGFLGKVYFLSEAAPQELLATGQEFDFKEGPIPRIRVRVIGESLP